MIHRTKSAISFSLTALAVILSVVVIAGCGEPELATIGIRSDSARLIIETSFTGETGYTVRTEQNGTCIVITAPKTKLSESIPRERLIDSIDMISGWFAKQSGDDVEVKFYLTGAYRFTQAAGPLGDSGGYGVRISIDAPPDSTMTAQRLEEPAAAASPAAATRTAENAKSSGTPLADGIALFREGRYDAALDSFNEAVGGGARCPLAYFYAARIRLMKEQYSRALANFETALRDSLGFVEAVGYRAYTLKKMGRESEARDQWSRFVASSGADTTIKTGIMTPDEFRAALEDSAKARREAELLRERAASRLAVATADSAKKASADSSATAVTAPVTPSAATADSGAVTQQAADAGADGAIIVGDVSALNKRIRSEIRKGLYGVAASLILLAAGIGGAVWWLRRKSSSNEARTFTREIGEFIGEREELEEIELNEDETARLYEEKRRIIDGEEEETAPESSTARSSAAYTVPAPETPPRAASAREFIPAIEEPAGDIPEYEPVHRRHFLEDASGRQPITEEIKGLVTRMHREGRKVEEICRAADLTKTEVELIIAVRAKHVEQLIDAAADTTAADDYDADHLYIAIRELRAEGDKPRDIARKLGISTSEINFALAVMDREDKMRR